MDHHEKHHQHHEKEREERIKHEKESERRGEKLPRRIHPAWFVALGCVLIVLVVLTWILVTSH
jgi:type VI protein secretion system component VasF